MADDKLAPAISAQGWQHLEQGATESAEKAYGALVALSPAKRPPWESLDQGQKETLTLIWFAGFLTVRSIPDSSS
jgi:hypothetical protein